MWKSNYSSIMGWYWQDIVKQHSTYNSASTIRRSQLFISCAALLYYSLNKNLGNLFIVVCSCDSGNRNLRRATLLQFRFKYLLNRLTAVSKTYFVWRKRLAMLIPFAVKNLLRNESQWYEWAAFFSLKMTEQRLNSVLMTWTVEGSTLAYHL